MFVFLVEGVVWQGLQSVALLEDVHHCGQTLRFQSLVAIHRVLPLPFLMVDDVNAQHLVNTDACCLLPCFPAMIDSSLWNQKANNPFLLYTGLVVVAYHSRKVMNTAGYNTLCWQLFTSRA